jgi:hypothetical protein
MRLTPTQIDTIHSTAQAVLGEGARVCFVGPAWCSPTCTTPVH